MRKNCYAILPTCAAICSRTRASSAPPPLMPAFLSYAFAFRRKGVQVKRKRKKTNNRITFPNPLQSPKARFVISRHRVVRLFALKIKTWLQTFQFPTAPPSRQAVPLLAAARSLAALTAHRAVIHYRSLGCGFALPTPYTGEANTCGIYSLHYQLDIKLNSSSVKPDFVLCS